MTLYEVGFLTTAYTTVQVEADDKDQAIELAYQKDKPTSCHQCPQVGDWEYEGELQISCPENYHEGVQEVSW